MSTLRTWNLRHNVPGARRIQAGAASCRDTDCSWVGSGVRISRLAASHPRRRVRVVEDESAVGDTPEFFGSYPVDGWPPEFSSRRRRFRIEERPPGRLFSSARTTYSCGGAVSPAWTEAFQIQHPEWVSQALRDSGGLRWFHSPPV